MSCACARARVALPIVDLHFCRWILLFGSVCFVFRGSGTRNFAFCFFVLQEIRGGNMLRICHGRQRPNAI